MSSDNSNIFKDASGFSSRGGGGGGGDGGANTNPVGVVGSSAFTAGIVGGATAPIAGVGVDVVGPAGAGAGFGGLRGVVHLVRRLRQQAVPR